METQDAADIRQDDDHKYDTEDTQLALDTISTALVEIFANYEKIQDSWLDSEESRQTIIKNSKLFDEIEREEQRLKDSTACGITKEKLACTSTFTSSTRSLIKLCKEVSSIQRVILSHKGKRTLTINRVLLYTVAFLGLPAVLNGTGLQGLSLFSLDWVRDLQFNLLVPVVLLPILAYLFLFNVTESSFKRWEILIWCVYIALWRLDPEESIRSLSVQAGYRWRSHLGVWDIIYTLLYSLVKGPFMIAGARAQSVIVFRRLIGGEYKTRWAIDRAYQSLEEQMTRTLEVMAFIAELNVDVLVGPHLNLGSERREYE